MRVQPRKRRAAHLAGCGFCLLPLVAWALPSGAWASADRVAAPIELPSPTGPMAVGTRVFHWIDHQREEIGTEDPSDQREVVVQLWYPGVIEPGAATAPYVHQAAVYRAHGMFDDEDVALVARVHHYSVLDAPPSPHGGRFPIVVFSTGKGEMAFMYTSLAEELASHGYLIAVISHPGVADVAYPDGHVLRRYARLFDPKPEGWDEGLKERNPLIAFQRAVYDGYYRESSAYLEQDVAFVIDRLAALDQGADGGALAGRLDLDRLATMGHSHGGNIAVEACARDPRVRACVDLDGAGFGWVREEGLEKPLMLIRPAYQNDGWPRGLAQEQLLGSMRADGYEVNVEGAEHRSFMDARFLFPESQRTATGPRRVLEITSAYTRAFFARYLEGSESPLLHGPASAYPEVSLRILRNHLTARQP